MRALVTGGAGFVGRHLVSLLVAEGCSTWSLDRREGATVGATSVVADLEDADVVSRVVAEARPDLVFHLAARTPANAPDATPAQWLGGDPVATHHLLEAVRRHVPGSRVLVVGSSAVYGSTPSEGVRIAETTPLRPTTLYGVTKAAVELAALRFHAAHGLAVVVARPFNLVGPGEPAGMLTSTLATQVVAIAGGASAPVVRMRHRATARDWTDVRDAVRAYGLLVERGVPGEVYNVCSGRAVGIGLLAERLLAIAGVEATIEETEAGPAPGDVERQAGDGSKITAATGWTPGIPLDESLASLLASLRGRLTA